MLEAESYENRGSAEHAFGYVYFTDGTRVLYVTTPEKVISGANWGPTGPTHKRLARELLEAEGIF